jgi:glycosyltransferase involved in cell wall biosynthesis
MGNFKILHLNSYYIDNHLYSQLYTKLNAFLSQVVYIPIKLDRKPQNIVELNNTELVFDKCIKSTHKYNYFGKINFLFKKVISRNLQQNIDFIHAHNLFTDGAIAYKIYKKYKVPYIVALRSTDINLQYKLMYHRRPFANNVLINANKIIFISPKYKEKFFAMLPEKLARDLSHKVQIVPNGIHDSWVNNPYLVRKVETKTKINLIYVGQIIKRKNINALLSAVELLNNKNESISYNLNIVGGEHQHELDYFNEFLKLVEKFDWLVYKGKVLDKSKLREIYRMADIFTMPSIGELFGLTYIEALSQGLPIIYSKGEGVDGFFEEALVGASVNAEDVEDIARGIETVGQSTYNDLHKIIEPFDWNKIIQEYLTLYKTDEQT